jgi:hypothetical protein
MTVRELYVAGKSFRVEGAGLEPVGRIRQGDREPDASERAGLHRLAWAQVGTVTAFFAVPSAAIVFPTDASRPRAATGVLS